MGFVSAWSSGMGMDPRGGRCAGAPVLRGAGLAAGSLLHPTPSRRVSYGTFPLLSRHKSSGPVRAQDEVGWLESPH